MLGGELLPASDRGGRVSSGRKKSPATNPKQSGRTGQDSTRGGRSLR